jgi:hypothetical protein
MADVYVAVDPFITIAATDRVCFFGRIALVPDQMMADTETFCDPGGERPSTIKWTLELEGKLSYDTDGAWNILRALQGTKVAFVVKPTDGATAVTNPSATFNAWVPAMPFMDANVGDSAPFTLTCPVVGQPTFATT